MHTLFIHPTPLAHIFSPPLNPPYPISPYDQEVMSGVWKFNNGVFCLQNPGSDQSSMRKKVLIYVPSKQVIGSYSDLESKLAGLGWERYYDNPDLLQFHKRSERDLISLPKDFNKFRSMHMYDIVVKNRNMFEVRDL